MLLHWCIQHLMHASMRSKMCGVVQVTLDYKKSLTSCCRAGRIAQQNMIHALQVVICRHYCTAVGQPLTIAVVLPPEPFFQAANRFLSALMHGFVPIRGFLTQVLRLKEGLNNSI
ncbi:hypothetical protein A7D17_22045 [Xanthomonas floridensis]|uniref:Uncharacterized protein n=1 Tax=Xanthomonas floridensis TaxID=1843580 RepID=A0A1A9M7Y1_9XANT|nr:hypothetical protein A7D17_22045 [Xanthomonas floridensis]